jgi:translation initiation factor 1A
MYGRVIRVLGNRNLLTYCNDNVVRLCHIRGSIRKDMWINIGDLVLISIREFLQDKKDKYEKGDILYKYDRDLYSTLKKDKDINTKLFLEIEKTDLQNIKKVQGTKYDMEHEEGFEFDKSDHDNDDGEDVDIDNI